MRLLLSFLLLPVLAFPETAPDLPNQLDRFRAGYNGCNYEVFTKGFTEELAAKWTKETFTSWCKNAPIIWGMIKEFEPIQTIDASTYRARAKLFSVNLFFTFAYDESGAIKSLDIRTDETIDFDNPPVASLYFRFPLRGEWKVVKGLDAAGKPTQTYTHDDVFVIDLIKEEREGRDPSGSESHTGRFPTHGQEVFAPCNGEVSQIIDSIPENAPGRPNGMAPDGNVIVIRYGKEEYFAVNHLLTGGFAVNAGQKVESGRLLAKLGNSGDIVSPIASLSARNTLLGQKGKSLKFGFACVEIFDGKGWQKKVNYSPVKGDLLRLCAE